MTTAGKGQTDLVPEVPQPGGGNHAGEVAKVLVSWNEAWLMASKERCLGANLRPSRNQTATTRYVKMQARPRRHRSCLRMSLPSSERRFLFRQDAGLCAKHCFSMFY
jgi:hypothetical protein